MAYRYPLTNEGINSGCEQIQSFIEHAEISNADRIKIPLLIEETLLQYQKLSGNGIDFALNLYKIMDAYKIDLRVNCDRLNPFIINVGTSFGAFVRCCEIQELSYRVQ